MLALVCGLPGANSAGAETDILYRAVLRERVISVNPPALVREGRLFLPVSFVRHGLGVTARPESPAQTWVMDFFDRRVRFAVGRTKALGSNGEIVLPAAPFLQDEEVYLPAELLRLGLGLVAEVGQDPQGMPGVRLYAPGTRVTGIREGSHPDRERLVLDLEGESPFSWQRLDSQLQIYLPPPAEATPSREVSLQGLHLRHLTAVSRSLSPEGFTQVEVTLAEASGVEVFTLSNPARIVIDVPLETGGTGPGPARPPTPAPPAALPANAPRWTVRRETNARGPLDVFVLRLQPNDPHWMLTVAMPEGPLGRRRSLTSLVAQVGGVAGLNGGFFSLQGPPVGIVAINGEWICTPAHEATRTLLAISKSGAASMGRWQFAGRVLFGGHGYLPLTAINRGHYEGDELHLFTRRWGQTLAGNAIYTRLVVSEGEVVVLKETAGREVEIPPQGYVLSGRGKYAALLKKIQVGDTARLDLRTEPPLGDVWCLLEGGPRLLVNGKPYIYSDVECFRADVAQGCGSRSAVGITKSGEILLVAVESPGASRGGVYLYELVHILLRLGAYQAMNLDGGGSTTVVQGNRVINRVAGNSRPIPTALVVVPRPEGG